MLRIDFDSHGCLGLVSAFCSLGCITPIALGAASLGSAAIGAGAAKSAASTQAKAAKAAAAQQAAQVAQVQNNLAPFVAAGTGAVNNLATDVAPGGSLTAPISTTFDMSPAALEQLPGYQFIQDQGLKATQNGYAANGLAESGAALKGAANYSEGLASTYQNQFFNQWQQQQQLALQQKQQIYGMESNLASIGENAAAGSGSLGLSGTAQAGQFATSGAAASAAGTVGSANATANGLGGLSTAALLNGLFGGSSGSSSSYDPNSANALLSGSNIAGIGAAANNTLLNSISGNNFAP